MKQFIRVLALLTLGGIVWASCSQLEDPQLQKSDVNLSDYSVSVQSAIERAKAVRADLFGTTRSSEQVAAVEHYMPLASTRGYEVGNGYYIVNFGDDTGFAIVGADTRLDAIYAISDSGSLSVADTSKNESLKWYLEDYLAIEQNSRMEDSSGNWTDIWQLDTTIFKPKNELFCNPLIKGVAVNIGEGSPYNKYCFTATGEQAVVGCAQRACGVVMSYFSWPNTWEGYSFDWANMKSSANNDGWARLMECLGRNGNLNSEYGVTSTSASVDWIPRTLYNMGYTTCNHIRFDAERAASLLTAQVPFIVAGWRNDGKGHGWVIDGGYIDKSGPVIIDPNGAEDKKYVFHCIWGWNGQNNGYFKLTNGTLGRYYDKLDNGSFTNYGTWSNLEMIYGFSPRK